MPRTTGEEEHADFAVTLMHTLRQGICLTLDLDESELRGFVLVCPTESCSKVVIYESSEGGTGTLEAVLDAATIRGVSLRCLELLHFGPDGSELDGGCESACYDCICNFHNQREHKRLKRHLVRDLLVHLTEVDAVVGGAGDDDRLADLLRLCANENERSTLTAIRQAGLRMPDSLHRVIRVDGEPVLEADLFYEPLDIVMVDGSIHYVKYVSEMDDAKRTAVRAAGYRVTVVRPDDLGGLERILGDVAR